MLFKPNHAQTFFQGRLVTEHPAAKEGRPVVVDLSGAAYLIEEVAFVVPDDEAQGARIQAAGYKIHTPLSVHLGVGGGDASGRP